MSLLVNQSNRLLPHSSMSTVSSIPTIDAEGGTVTEIIQTEELDPLDGCPIHVTTYKILSADGNEELTKTVRRKMKIDCTAKFRSLQVDARGEQQERVRMETAMFNLDDMLSLRNRGDQRMMLDRRDPQGQRMMLDHRDPQDQRIAQVLEQTSTTFNRLFNDRRRELIAMFPELSLHSNKEINGPGDGNGNGLEETETFVHPDGSITTRSKQSRAFSSHFTKHETFINGIKQESRVRAFMEYSGPEGGYKVKLSDGGDQSEEEDEEERGDSDSRSEISDSRSALGFTDAAGQPCIKEGDSIRRRVDKAWHAANELVQTEQHYVDKLRMLDEMFRARLEAEKILDREQIQQMFANLSSLHRFHNEHLLKPLLEHLRDWHSTHKMSAVLRKQAPFLKMYSEYINNHSKQRKAFDLAKKTNKRFQEMVALVETSTECDNLPLDAHLICPVQRVTRYPLLLQEYKKHLSPSDPDYEDTEEALKLVVGAAGHANEMMRKLDRYRDVIEVQEQIGGVITLLTPSRELISRGKLIKISSKTNKYEERTLFLFSDLILICSDRSLPGFAKYKVRALFHADNAMVCEGDNLEKENAFYVRGTDSEGRSRCVELCAGSSKEKQRWMDEIWSVIQDAHCRKKSFATVLDTTDEPVVTPSRPSSTTTENSGDVCPKNSGDVCPKCDSEFSSLLFFSRGIKCIRCEKRICKKCFGRLRNAEKSKRICDDCCSSSSSSSTQQQKDQNHSISTIIHRHNSPPPPPPPLNGQKSPPPSNGQKKQQRSNVLQISANEGPQLCSGWIQLKCSQPIAQRRFCVIRRDLCLYSYASEMESNALAMLPLAGCELKMAGGSSFTIRHGHRLYSMLLEREELLAQFMAALDLASNAAAVNNIK